MSDIFATRHSVHFLDATGPNGIPEGSVDLVVTSPPYPMIEMWDAQFAAQDPGIADALACGDGASSFEAMHALLDAAWREVYRVLRPGALACINIGDATRSIGGSFRLFSNHSRVLQFLTSLGFQCLPQVVWRKPTNGPTKFVGSGTLPAGAYVTLEHEWILIVRKGGLRRFADGQDRARRRESAFFWEERNLWFSDLWELKGTRQGIDRPRADRDSSQLALWPGESHSGNYERRRSASYPYELPERLIRMFSLYGDLVLDPFLGTGTTLLAAVGCGRNSIGVELDRGLGEVIRRRVEGLVPDARERAAERLERHLGFVAMRRERGKEPAHRSHRYGFPVISRQETEIRLRVPAAVDACGPWDWVAHYRELEGLG